MSGRRGSRAAFTLVELLVVIGIIALLIAILLPSLNKARQQSQGVACGNNVKQLMFACLLFAQDHKNRLPGNYFDHTNTDENKQCWMLGSHDNTDNATTGWMNGPEAGTIFKYTNNARLYRCPSRPDAVARAGGESNGKFDYAAFQVLAGALITKVKPTARYQRPDGTSETLPTPFVCEEDPRWAINSDHVEAGHANTDKIAKTHNGGAYYATIDGSVHFIKEDPNSNCHNWFLVAPSGVEKEMGTGTTYWGFWNTQ